MNKKVDVKEGTLFMIPVILAPETSDSVILPSIKNLVSNLNYYLVENIRTSRRFISSLKTGVSIEEIRFEQFDNKTSVKEIGNWLDLVKQGKDVGIMSEAGAPGIADPGANIVRKAHQMGIKVVPLVGPSAIFLTLMASGFNGQCFKFHGYLPIDSGKRRKKLLQLEQESIKLDQTQLFMETPYRNNALLKHVVETFHPDTELCIATDITGENEEIKTLPIWKWKKALPDLHKRPTVFACYAVKN